MGPLGNAGERCGAKHQALRATEVLHLRNGKRDAGREKVEAQAKGNMRVFCWERSLWGGNVPQLAESQRNLSFQRLRTFTGHLEDQISAHPRHASQPASCLLRAWRVGACPAHLVQRV